MDTADITRMSDEKTNLLAGKEQLELFGEDKDHDDEQEDDHGDQESDSDEEESYSFEKESGSDEDESDSDEDESDSDEDESDSDEEESYSFEKESGSDEDESDQEDESELNEKLGGLWLRFCLEEDQGCDQGDEALKMALLNVHSMNKEKKKKIKNLITRNNLDVFLPTETWLKKDTADRALSEASPPHFSFCHQAREGRGVAILFSQALQGEQHQQVIIKKPKTFGYVDTVLHHDKWNQPVLLINVFHPPGNLKNFLVEFQKLLNEALKHYNSILITGDFNMKRSTIEFQQLLKENNLVQHVKDPTHQSGHTLDLVITRNVEISGLTVQNNIKISDHYAVIFNARPMTKDAKEKDKEKDHQGNESLKMALLNIWLVNNKPSTISEFIRRNNLDVFLATEIGEGGLREALPPNFSLHHYVRKHRGGGVAVQCSNALWDKCIHFKYRTFECVAAELHHGKWNQPVLLINVYRPPGNLKNLTKFLVEFQKLLNEVSEDYNNIIITGDFNIHVDNETMPSTTKFQQLLEENNLVQHVKEPTHQSTHTLDLVITRNVEISGLTVRNDEISDHYTVYFTAKPVKKDTMKTDKENDVEEEKAQEPEL